MNKSIALSDEKVISKIIIIRGKKVILDKDLAELYGVETKVLNQAVKRNYKRFPDDFMIQLNGKEFKILRSQIVTSNRGGLKYAPYAFTEQGVAMLSSVLNSKTAIEVNIQIIRVFTRMRELVLTHKDILLKLEQLEKKSNKHDEEIQLIFTYLKKLLNPPNPARRRIGYKP